MPRTALGIPDRDVYGDPLAGLSAGQLADWVVQKHKAERAGEHYDIRLGTPETGLYSWVSRKGIPAPGEKRLAISQPIHAHGYKDFQGEISSGYGKGQVARHDLGQVLITKVEPNAIHFTTAHRRFPERYVLIKPKTGRNWLMINTTKTTPIPYEKVRYTLVQPDKAQAVIASMQPGSSAQAKIDGAAALVQLYKDHFDVLSYRRQKHTGWPIIHTERIFGGRPQVEIPPQYRNQTLRGELYGVDPTGKVIPPYQLGGLLNASIAKSLKDQQAIGVKLKVLLFDIMNKRHQHQLGVPYEQRLTKTKQVGSVLPGNTFHYPEEAKTPEEARALLSQVASGQHPLSAEGIVIHPPKGKPSKIKLRDEHDVYIREFFPGMGKYTNVGVGGFRYSFTPKGPIVGEVGTGLTDEQRMDMYKNPDIYLGRIARVSAQAQRPSGALFAPSFISLHEDYPTKTVESDDQLRDANIRTNEFGNKAQTLDRTRKWKKSFGHEKDLADIKLIDQHLKEQAVLNAVKATSSPLARIQAQQSKPVDLIKNVRPAKTTLQTLLAAKTESDRKNYAAKHDAMRQLISQYPQEFFIDSDLGKFVGITHRPTGFRMHLPKTVLPTALIAPSVPRK
jgi:hypothetical protein